MVPPSLGYTCFNLILQAILLSTMLLTLTSSAIFTLIILLFTAPSPLPLGALILLLALSNALLIASFTSSWFGLILFLIYVGGLLVIFIYFAALCPNHFISFKHTLALSLSSFFLSSSSLYFLFPILTPLSILPLPLQNTTAMFFINNLPALLFLSITLFLILVTVVTTTRHTQGPLRPFS